MTLSATVLENDQYRNMQYLRGLLQKETERAAKAGETTPSFMHDQISADLQKAIADLDEDLKAKQKADAEKAPAEVLDEARSAYFQGKVNLTDHERTKMEPDVAEAEYRAIIKEPSSDARVQRIQKLNDALYLMQSVVPLVAADPNSRGKISWKGPQSLRTYKQLQSYVGEFHKAMATSLTAAGTEWAAEEWSGDLVTSMFLYAGVVNMHDRITIGRGFKTQKIRRLTGRGSVFYVPESDDDSSPEYPTSQLTTGNFTLEAKKFSMNVYLSEEMLEDTIMTDWDIARRELMIEMGNALEDAIINGSTLMTDLDNVGGTKRFTETTDVRHAFNGYRKSFVSSGATSVDLSTWNYENLLQVRGKVGGKPSVDVGSGFWLVNPTGLTKLMSTPEVKTLDVFGPNATVVKGTIGAFAGSPIVYTDKVAVDLAASGLYTGSGATTILIYVYKPGFIVAEKREAEFLTTRVPETGQWRINIFMRMGFDKRFVASTPVVGLGRNFS